VVSPTAKAQRRKRRAKPPAPPARCPACDTPTVKPDGGVWTICPNRAGCPGQVLQHVKHFVGAMDIDGFGEETAIRFLREGVIKDAADIYELDKDRLVQLEGFGEISANNLLANIEGSKQQPFFRVLYALGIPGIGWVNARNLAAHFGSMEALVEANEEQIVETEGVGPVMANTIMETLSEERTQELIKRLREVGLQMEQEGGPIPGTEGPLAGKTFVITGTLPNLSREEATERLEAAGAKVTNSVSKKTDYLVLGAEPGTKLAKAEKLGTEILDEDGLLALLA